MMEINKLEALCCNLESTDEFERAYVRMLIDLSRMKDVEARAAVRAEMRKVLHRQVRYLVDEREKAKNEDETVQ